MDLNVWDLPEKTDSYISSTVLNLQLQWRTITGKDFVTWKFKSHKL